MPKQKGEKSMCNKHEPRINLSPISEATETNGENNVKAEEQSEPLLCSICEEVIKESTEKTLGEEAIYCERQCEAWFHRKCAVISKSA